MRPLGGMPARAVLKPGTSADTQPYPRQAAPVPATSSPALISSTVVTLSSRPAPRAQP
jgi:hypothetical protein